MKKSAKLNYFYLDGRLEKDGPTIPLLHKRLHINRGTDTITTWCYPLTKRVTYAYSDVRARHQPAYTTTEVSKMMNRATLILKRAITNGDIAAPQLTYGLNERKNNFKYMWAEHNILEAHAFFSSRHFGRPRNDGMITPKLLPTRRELRAMIRQEPQMFVQNDQTGDFEPVWRAPDFS